MMRKLATIRKIDAISPIKGADSIECATVGGWKVVIKKDDFKVGDLVVYLEIDSWVPHELAPFLNKGSKPKEYNGIEGYRLRTVKLRGQVSQGLILPVPSSLIHNREGTDITELLNVQKWEPPISAQLAGVMRGNFPSVVPKTDQERIQNLNVDDIIENGPYTITEKLDGSSCTFYLSKGEDTSFHVCSRNIDLVPDPKNTLWAIAYRDNIEQKMRDNGLEGYAIQGEVVGPGIQGNYYELKGHQFFVFDIFNTNTGEYVNHFIVDDVVKLLGLNHVPLTFNRYYPTPSDASTLVADLLTCSDGYSDLIKKPREGRVFKSLKEKRYTFKVISNEYLLKEK
jgi:RNA ligase (TIGR02306 family)